jgi:protein TonB
MPARSITKTTIVSVVETKKKPKPKPDEPKKEPPKPDEPKEPKTPPIVKPAPKPVAPPPPAPIDVPPPPPVANAPTPNAFANPGLSGLQNIGMMTGGPGGIAIGPGGEGGGGGAPAPSVSATTKAKEKVLGGAPTANLPSAGGGGGLDDCAEEATKPKPTAMPQPSYSDEARSAEIEGVVTVRVRVDASGHVIEATVTKALGHGLDERAVAAAKSWTFSPSTKCGKPAESKFVMNMRFALGE